MIKLALYSNFVPIGTFEIEREREREKESDFRLILFTSRALSLYMNNPKLALRVQVTNFYRNARKVFYVCHVWFYVQPLIYR